MRCIRTLHACRWKPSLIFWRHSHRYHRKFMQYKGRPNRIKWKMELRRWRHSIFHFSFSIFHSRWKMELIWTRMYFRFSDISRKWKMDCWRRSFNIFAWMKNEKWKMEVDIPFFIWWHQMKNQNNGMYTDRVIRVINTNGYGHYGFLTCTSGFDTDRSAPSG